MHPGRCKTAPLPATGPCMPRKHGNVQSMDALTQHTVQVTECQSVNTSKPRRTRPTALSTDSAGCAAEARGSKDWCSVFILMSEAEQAVQGATK